MDLEPADVVAAARWAESLLASLPEPQWQSKAGDIEWSIRRTVDHLADTMYLYAGYVALRAVDRIQPPRNGDPSATNEGLLAAFDSGAMVLSRLLDDLGDERAFHPSGMADRTGWIGMACTEIIVHTLDATGEAGRAASGDVDALARATVDRVLPWTPPEGAGIERLLWATGRAALGGRPPESADWWWHSAPIAEWDGASHRRSSPPQW